MTRSSMFLVLLSLSAATPVMAQHRGGGGGGGGRGGGGGGGRGGAMPGPARGPAFAVPVRGPAPFRGVAPRMEAPVVARPHVEQATRWVGHDQGAGDARFHLARPWAGGRFQGRLGGGTPYRLGGWDGSHHFWFGGGAFELAAPDWGYVSDWNWADDQVVLYPDPDHEGWYLAYNVRLGTYVHVEYDGPHP